MGLTVTTNPANTGRSDEVWGRVRIATVQVTFDSVYVEGGEAFDPTAYGIPTPRQVIVSARPHARFVHAAYDHANNKILAYGKADGTRTYDELCGCDLSALVVDVLIIGD